MEQRETVSENYDDDGQRLHNRYSALTQQLCRSGYNGHCPKSMQPMPCPETHSDASSALMPISADHEPLLVAMVSRKLYHYPHKFPPGSSFYASYSYKDQMRNRHFFRLGRSRLQVSSFPPHLGKALPVGGNRIPNLCCHLLYQKIPRPASPKVAQVAKGSRMAYTTISIIDRATESPKKYRSLNVL